MRSVKESSVQTWRNKYLEELQTRNKEGREMVVYYVNTINYSRSAYHITVFSYHQSLRYNSFMPLILRNYIIAMVTRTLCFMLRLSTCGTTDILHLASFAHP